MSKKKIKIGLLPSDFIGTSFGDNLDCALAKAAIRHFNTNAVSCCTSTLTINLDRDVSEWREFIVKHRFDQEDFDYVKEQYAKDPKMKKVQYEVTLIEQ